MKELLLFIFYIIIFLCAMAILRHGLLNLTGDALRDRIQRVAATPVKGFFTGMFFTALLQSSSAVMVMTVGLVSVGGLTFQQSIGIILGSNIGTTITAEFMTFSLERWIFPGIFAGFILVLTGRRILRHTGFALMGLFLIFFAIGGFTSLAEPLSGYPFFSMLLASVEDHLLFAVFTGALITALIHSSTATIGIAMGFIAGNEMSVAAGIALMLGSNIGTCITGYIAALGSPKEAKLTAYAHIWLNLLGVALFYPFISELEWAAALLTDAKQVQLAHASVLFNIICSLLVLPFTNLFSRFILSVHDRNRTNGI